MHIAKYTESHDKQLIFVFFFWVKEMRVKEIVYLVYRITDWTL